MTSSPLSERWPSVLQGIASIGAGVVVFAWPGITVLVLLYVIGARTIAKGVFEMDAAWLRADGEPRMLLGLCRIVAVIFGVSIYVHPGAGAIAVIALIAALALSVGVILLAAGIGLGRWKHNAEDRRDRAQELVGAAIPAG